MRDVTRERTVAPGLVANTWRLDLDYLSPVARQQFGGEGGCDVMAELDDLEPRQGCLPLSPSTSVTVAARS